MWYVYFLENKERGFLYVGSTNDLRRRMEQHRGGFVRSTRLKIPLDLVAYVALPTEVQARKLESYFKTGSGKAILKKRILQY